MCSGFLMGFAVDLFNGTPGLNAAATVFVAFVRPTVINGMMRRGTKSSKTLNFMPDKSVWFLKILSLHTKWLSLALHYNALR